MSSYIYIKGKTLKNLFAGKKQVLSVYNGKTKIWSKDPNLCNLFVIAEGGHGITTGSGTYEKNTDVEISVVPKKGWLFVKWNDGNTSLTRIVTVKSDITYIAEFKENTGILNYKENY